MNSANVRIVPTSAAVASSLSAREDYKAIPGATPEVGERGSESVCQDIAVVGECSRFDLSMPEDRQAYADLSARLFSGADCVRLWEERIAANGSMIVFVSYINYTNVFQTAARPIDLGGSHKK